jgi:hypothetical protein
MEAAIRRACKRRYGMGRGVEEQGREQRGRNEMEI